jgi:hypothetical protein
MPLRVGEIIIGLDDADPCHNLMYPKGA